MENKTLEPTNGNQEQELERKKIAIRFMASFISASGFDFNGSYKMMAEEAVKATDAILEALKS